MFSLLTGCDLKAELSRCIRVLSIVPHAEKLAKVAAAIDDLVAYIGESLSRCTTHATPMYFAYETQLKDVVTLVALDGRDELIAIANRGLAAKMAHSLAVQTVLTIVRHLGLAGVSDTETQAERLRGLFLELAFDNTLMRAPGSAPEDTKLRKRLAHCVWRAASCSEAAAVDLAHCRNTASLEVATRRARDVDLLALLGADLVGVVAGLLAYSAVLGMLRVSNAYKDEPALRARLPCLHIRQCAGACPHTCDMLVVHKREVRLAVDLLWVEQRVTKTTHLPVYMSASAGDKARLRRYAGVCERTTRQRVHSEIFFDHPPHTRDVELLDAETRCVAS